MYLQNKYTRIYNNIIERAKSRTISGYIEKHHIIPKSLGGDDSKDNIVELTSKEHFICHRLLPKMLEGEEKRKMTFALKIMTSDRHSLRYKPNSRTFEYVRKLARQAQIGVPLSEERRKKISESNMGKEQSEETKQKRAESLRGKKRTAEQKQRQSEAAKRRWAKKDPEAEAQRIAKIKEARSKQIITTIQVTCPHCGKTGGNRIMPRYHFDNCKKKGSR